MGRAKDFWEAYPQAHQALQQIRDLAEAIEYRGEQSQERIDATFARYAEIGQDMKKALEGERKNEKNTNVV